MTRVRTVSFPGTQRRLLGYHGRKNRKIEMKPAIALLLIWAMASCAVSRSSVQVGPRPYYLIEQMAPSTLRTRLESCDNGPFVVSNFSISHRGAPLQFPEHTRAGYQAAARMGAGIMECDVTFTRDGELVCRHAQCDLHATTDIVARADLRDSCLVPPKFDANGELENAAAVTCCASDLTLAEFKSLCGKMEGANPHARSIEAYLAATPAFRTDLYDTCGALLSHFDSIELFKSLGLKFAPELKGLDANADGFGTSGLDQASYASRLIDEYRRAGVSPGDVFVQSFDLEDVRYWAREHPEFARQAVYLVGGPGGPAFAELHELGVRILGVPIGMLLTLDADGALVASDYARGARGAGLELIAWSAERSGRMREDVKPAGGAYYYASIESAISDDGAVMEILHALDTEVGVLGVFSDWPGTVTYYASCLR